jgi:hypothetical protein
VGGFSGGDLLAKCYLSRGRSIASIGCACLLGRQPNIPRQHQSIRGGRAGLCGCRTLPWEQEARLGRITRFAGRSPLSNPTLPDDPVDSPPEIYDTTLQRLVHRGEGPTLYPVACSPQAWAAGAVFLLVQACLGVSIQAASNRILFDRPYLPEGIPQLWIKGLRISKGSVDIFFERRNDAVRVEVTDQQGEIEVVATPSAEALNIV